MSSNAIWKGPRIVKENLEYYLFLSSLNCVDPNFPTDVRDISGKNNILSLMNDPIYTSEFGGVYSFDGTDQHINTNLVSNFPSFSVNILMKATNLSGSQVFVGSNNGVNDWWVGQFFNNFVFSANGSIVNSLNLVGTASYYLVTTTFSPDSRNIYINGTLAASASSFALQNTGNIHIAKFGDTNTFYAAMNLGAFIFHSKELTSTEVSSTYNSLKGYYGLA